MVGGYDGFGVVVVCCCCGCGWCLFVLCLCVVGLSGWCLCGFVGGGYVGVVGLVFEVGVVVLGLSVVWSVVGLCGCFFVILLWCELGLGDSFCWFVVYWGGGV